MVKAALMLAVTAMIAVGCMKPDDPNNNGGGDNGGGNNGGGNNTTASVTPELLIFESESATQSVTVSGPGYSYYGASVDADGQGWCTVAAPGNNKIDITVTTNTGTTRTCYVNCWVANTLNPTESEKVILPVLVTQNPYKMEVTEATYIMANFETKPQRDVTWTYDGGGHFTSVDAMSWLWHKNWGEMNVSHTNDTLMFWAKDIVENAPNGDTYYDHEYIVSIMITGFREPFNNCEVNTVNYKHTYVGHNPSTNAYWVSTEGEDGFILTHIPLVSHNINISNKTGRLYFKYTGQENVSVIEYFDHWRSDTYDGKWQEEIRTYIGGDNDEGEVELNFKLK